MPRIFIPMDYGTASAYSALDGMCGALGPIIGVALGLCISLIIIEIGFIIFPIIALIARLAGKHDVAKRCMKYWLFGSVPLIGLLVLYIAWGWSVR
jgi:hypothetical protein